MSQALSRLPAAQGTKRRRLGMSLSAVPLVLLSACGGSGGDTAATPTTSQETSSTDSATGGSTDASSGGSASANVLTGTVGKGDAYVITLVDSTGAPVHSLKAGAYTVKIKDDSRIHDFHLTGPGVDESTSVPQTTSVTWSVNLQKGSYTYVCDPHAQSMTGSFTVS